MSCLIYTFRTLPFLVEIEESFDNVVVVGKLKKDLQFIEDILLRNRVEKVIGLAQSWNRKVSFTEPVAINRFHKTKQIILNGPENFYLNKPDDQYNFQPNQKPGDSFCNWMMYRVAKICVDHKLKTQHFFFHCNQPDIPKIIQVATS